MPPPQIITGFSGDSQIDFFKCLLLFKKIKIERDKTPEDPSKSHTREKIFSLKRALDFSRFESYRNTLNLEIAEKFAAENFLKIKIWKQTDRRRPVFLEYETKIDGDPADFCDLDLFSKNFDTFKNQDFSNIQLVLDISKFLSKKKYAPAENKPMFRHMTLFQARKLTIIPKGN